MTARCVFCNAVPTKDVLCCEPYRAVRMLRPRSFDGLLTPDQSERFMDILRRDGVLHGSAATLGRSKRVPFARFGQAVTKVSR